MDTTDALGRVDFTYHAYDPPGPTYQIIHAEYCRGAAEVMMAIVPIGFAHATLNLMAEPDTVYAAYPLRDSVRVTALLADSSDTGLPGFQLLFTANGGSFSNMPPTDLTGRTTGFWYPADYGRFRITSRVGGLADTVWVQVDSLRRRS